jgi:hypothetical protein
VGKKHGFKLFCESKTSFAKSTRVKTDTGYPGIMNLHDNSELPHKRSKFHPLSKGLMRENRAIARTRVANEHATSFVKRFRILSERPDFVNAPPKSFAEFLRFEKRLNSRFSVRNNVFV